MHDPLTARYAQHVHQRLDLDLMRRAPALPYPHPIKP